MRYISTLLASAVILLVQAADAQVFKCKDAQGRSIYSDSPCSSSQSGGQLERKRTFEEKMREREQAYEAQMVKRERKAHEVHQERLEAEQQAIATSMQPRVPQHKGYAERLAERNAGVNSKFAPPLTRAQRGLPPLSNRAAGNPPAPSVMTHCAGGFCNDNQGGVYHQHGNGTTMTGPNGGTCVQTGTMVQC